MEQYIPVLLIKNSTPITFLATPLNINTGIVMAPNVLLVKAIILVQLLLGFVTSYMNYRLHKSTYKVQ